MNADKILPILCRYLKDTDNRLLARWKIDASDLWYNARGTGQDDVVKISRLNPLRLN